jgi:hypothetical protein
MSELYAPEEPRSFDAIVERQPYKPTKESADPFVGEDGLRDAADAVNERRQQSPEPVKRQIHDPESPANIAPADVTITAETAAEALSENRRLEEQYEQWGRDAQTVAEIDAVKADQPVETQPTERPDWTPEPQPETAPAEPTELDHLLEALPAERRAPFIQAYAQQIQQAQEAAAGQYSQHLAQAQNYAQQYEQGVAQTLLVSEAAAVAPFPELANAPVEQRQAVLAHIGRTNPERYAQIKAHVTQVKELASNQIAEAQRIHQYQQAEKQQQQAEYRQAFERYAAEQDARTMVNESPKSLQAIQSRLLADAEKAGITKQQLGHIWNTSEVARHSFFQNLIADGIKYRQSKEAVSRAAYRPAPQVQRPGTRSDEAVQQSAYSVLERQLRNKGGISAKDGAALLVARRAR